MNSTARLNEDELSLFNELCLASKEGDLEKVENLVNNFGAPINCVDEWQCSPLYWACLCGHYTLAKYLLEHGSQCDRNTFEGERCLYGALTNDIRNLLLSYKISKAINENQPYLLFLTRLEQDGMATMQGPCCKDLTFRINSHDGASHDVGVHRFVMAAPSTHFDHLLLTSWRHRSIVEPHDTRVDPAAFTAVIHHLYTGQVPHRDNETLNDNINFVCHHLQLPLVEQQDVTRIRDDFDKFLRQRVLAAAAVVDEDNVAQIPFLKHTQMVATVDSLYADVAIWLGDDRVIFPCHKSSLCRSDYFQTMLSGDFAEASLKPARIMYAATGQILHVPVLTLLDVPAVVFPYILEYLYTDRCSIPVEHAYDVLLVADRLLLDRIKSFAAIALTSHTEPPRDIYELMNTAILLDVDRLEQWCIAYFADHLDSYVQQPAFLDLIHTSAHSIQARQETDSIPFIDDLRHQLGKKYGIRQKDASDPSDPMEESDEEEADEEMAGENTTFWTDAENVYHQKLGMLDHALESLGFEA